MKRPIRDAMKTYLGTAIEIADVELWDPHGKRIFASARRSPS